MARDIRVSYKLSENVHIQFKQIAEDYGVTMSALTSLIVGQWVYQQNKVVGPMIEVMREVVADQMQHAIKQGDSLDRQA